MSGKPVPVFGEECVTFNDGEGHEWHVPFEEQVSVPRVGELVLLPMPPGPNQPYSVIQVQYHFVQQDAPEFLGFPPVRGQGAWMYAKTSKVIVMVRAGSRPPT